jgi:hypothetical protein
MPAQKPTPAEQPSDELLLAAIDRAERHTGRNEPGESLRRIAEHLGLPFHSGTSKRLRPQLDALHTAGLVEPLRRHGVNLWALTSNGRARLRTLCDNDLDSLPEAPQHRRWREARTAASERIAAFRGDLRGTLDEAIALLEADLADSATWFELSERLHDTCWRFASAVHCLREWPEPDDSQADTDEPSYNQRGRRHTRGWDR